MELAETAVEADGSYSWRRAVREGADGRAPGATGACCELAGGGGRRGSALAARAERVAKRLAEGRFHVMVVGEFKRGKSTLVNALLGVEVLPTGVLPLTAVMTEVVHGDEARSRRGFDGVSFGIGLDELADYVTEAGNPGNERGVERVEVRVPASVLASGVVLVDTPGLGSIHLHNTEVGRRRCSRPMARSWCSRRMSRSRLRNASCSGSSRSGGSRTFLVVNKADHLGSAELDEVRRFITGEVTRGVRFGDGTGPVLRVGASWPGCAPRAVCRSARGG